MIDYLLVKIESLFCPHKNAKKDEEYKEIKQVVEDLEFVLCNEIPLNLLNGKETLK